MKVKMLLTKGEDPEKVLTEAETKNKLRKAIVRIIKLDCLTTDPAQFCRQAIDKKVVLNTWRGLLPKNVDLLKTWRMSNEVLVGIG